jgi:hypothetical protein
MNLLIPYIQLRPPDPVLNEFTYGDVGARAHKLKSGLSKGDYVFFHTSKGGKKYITAYYVVDRVLDTVIASQDKAIKAKYQSPHILECLEGKRPLPNTEDAILFGDPIKSRVLDRPLSFDKTLADKLSLKIKFPPNQSITQVIGSATRAWRQLTDRDVNALLKAIKLEEKHTRLRLLKSDEVAETIEKDVEDYIARNPSLIGKGLRLSERQLAIGSGRIDLLLEGKKGNLVVVEVKLSKIGRNALQQIQSYIHEMKVKEPGKKISGVIVCAEVMQAYENEIRKQKDARILIYGWEMKIRPW